MEFYRVRSVDGRLSVRAHGPQRCSPIRCLRRRHPGASSSQQRLAVSTHEVRPASAARHCRLVRIQSARDARAQAAIEGIGIMLQRSTAPPPSGMPMDMPMVDAPKPPSEVLIGGAAPGAGGDADVLLPDLPAAPDAAPPKKRGWFSLGA